MKKIRRILGIGNIIIGIVLFLILQLSNVSKVFSTIMLLSLFIGWIFPYIALIVSGLGILIHSNYLITLLFNIINVLVLAFMLFLVIKVYDKKMLIVLIEYIIILIVTIINMVYLVINKENIKQDNIERNYK